MRQRAFLRTAAVISIAMLLASSFATVPARAQTTPDPLEGRVAELERQLRLLERDLDQEFRALRDEIEATNEKAEGAQSTADDATSRAVRAQTTADSAQSAANNAQGTANSAVMLAENLKKLIENQKTSFVFISDEDVQKGCPDGAQAILKFCPSTTTDPTGDTPNIVAGEAQCFRLASGGRPESSPDVAPTALVCVKN